MTVDSVQYARRWKTLGVLSLSLVIIGLDNTILNVALPTLQDELDASPSKLQWMVDSYLLVFASLLLVFGTLGDRFGRKLALQAGVSIFGLASLGAVVADSADQVIAVRAAMGIGAALIMPATLSIIANVFSGEERGKAIAIWAALAAVGIGLGPLAGGLLLEVFAWPAVFLVNVPVAVAALVFGMRYVPESRDPRPGSFDLLGAALSAAGFSALVYGIIEAPDQGWTSGLVLGSLASSVALLGAFVWWERRTEDPMLDLRFFRSARFSVGTGAVSVAFFALLGAIFALTQYLQFAHGYSAIEAGVIMSPIALGLMMGAGSSSKAVRRLGTARVVAMGLGGLAVLLAVTSLWDATTDALLLAAWFFGLALAMGWVMAPATEAVIGAVPAAKSGVASATNTVARMVSGALGVAVVGSLVSSLYSADVEGSLDALPPQAQTAAESSVGAASAIAAQLPNNAAEEVLTATGDAFTQAMGTGLLVAAALAGAMAVVVIRFLPARPSEEATIAKPDVPPIAHVRERSVRRRVGVWVILVALVLGAASRLRTDKDLVSNSLVSSASYSTRWLRSGSPDSRSASSRATGSPTSGASARRTTPGDRLLRRLRSSSARSASRSPHSPSCSSSRPARSSSMLPCSGICRGFELRTNELPPRSRSAISSIRPAACRPRPDGRSRATATSAPQHWRRPCASCAASSSRHRSGRRTSTAPSTTPSWD
jgi:EmrB/QacA subfamily drug resistance transporter